MILTPVNSADNLSLNQLLSDCAQEVFGEGHINFQYERQSHKAAQTGGQHLEEFQDMLQQQFGSTGGRGAAILTGRSMFNALLHALGESLGWWDQQFCMQPTAQRMKSGLHSLAHQWGHLSGDEIQVEEMDDHWMWKQGKAHPHLPAGKKFCDLTVGLLQEFTRWVSGGKFYDVHEVPAHSDDENLRMIKISKRALD